MNKDTINSYWNEFIPSNFEMYDNCEPFIGALPSKHQGKIC